MAEQNVTNLAKQLKYTGKGYLDFKAQPANTLEELKERLKNNNELKLGMTVTVLNVDTDNVPVDYWYFHPFNEVTGEFDYDAAPDWYPKVNGGKTGDELFWEDGAASITDPDFEAWKDEGVE